MENTTYFDLLAALGIEFAHPGGFELTKYVLSILPINNSTKILEVGCGAGNTTKHIYKKYGNKNTVIENNIEMLRKTKINFLKENIPVQIVKGNAERMPFLNKSFDIILSESVTAFTDLNLSLKEYHRVLHDLGLFVAIEMSIERHLSGFEENEIKSVYGVRRILTELEWIDWLNKNNFKTVRIIGGNVIANTKNSQIPPNNISNLSNELQNKFIEHQRILHKYKHILGYRIFLCEK